MNYFINGIGFVTAESSGCGKKVKTFNPKSGKLSPILRKNVLNKPYKPFGRMDFFSKIGFAGTYFSYKDAGLIHLESTGTKTIQTSDTAIIVSTHLRCLETDNNYFQTMQPDNGKNASPALFAYALPNAFLGEASIFLKATGQCFAINEDTLDGITLLKMTFDILDSGESANVICGICDTNVPAFIGDMLKYKNKNFSGSLFFTISKKEQQFNYGKIEAGKNDTILFNGIRIENLVQLGQVCIKHYNNKG